MFGIALLLWFCAIILKSQHTWRPRVLPAVLLGLHRCCFCFIPILFPAILPLCSVSTKIVGAAVLDLLVQGEEQDVLSLPSQKLSLHISWNISWMPGSVLILLSHWYSEYYTTSIPHFMDSSFWKLRYMVLSHFCRVTRKYAFGRSAWIRKDLETQGSFLTLGVKNKNR